MTHSHGSTTSTQSVPRCPATSIFIAISLGVFLSLFFSSLNHTLFLSWILDMNDFSSLLQHVANCYKALFTNKLSCASVSVAIIHPANKRVFTHYVTKLIWLPC